MKRGSCTPGSSPLNSTHETPRANSACRRCLVSLSQSLTVGHLPALPPAFPLPHHQAGSRSRQGEPERNVLAHSLPPLRRRGATGQWGRSRVRAAAKKPINVHVSLLVQPPVQGPANPSLCGVFDLWRVRASMLEPWCCKTLPPDACQQPAEPEAQAGSTSCDSPVSIMSARASTSRLEGARWSGF
eukprot:1121887-Rhodomonas_salina.4